MYTFPVGISSEVNVIAWLEFEFIYYDVSIPHVSNYTMVTSERILYAQLHDISYFYLIQIIHTQL